MLGACDSLHVEASSWMPSTFVYDPLQDGVSPLYVAAQNGHSEVVRALLEGGADVNQAIQVGAINVSLWSSECHT